jgi:uncharacterized protein
MTPAAMISISRSDPSDFAADFPRFVPRAPWWGGDLQTLRNSLIRKRDRVSGYRSERVCLSLSDGSGDRLVATVNVPDSAPRQRPLVILVHGVTGSELSPYVTSTAAYCLTLGFPVVRINLRGAGPSRPLCRFQYHAGQTEDLRDAIAALPTELTSGGIVGVGYSLGANLLLKFLGERGRAAPLLAAVAVSAPLDLVATAERLKQRRNFIYHRSLLNHMRSETLAAGSALSVGERLAVKAARTLWQFDNDFTAPRNGYAGAGDYYTRNSCGNFLDRIAVPTLMIHAFDDPITPAAPYGSYEWHRNRKLVPLLTRYGGHVGFAGRGSRVAWHDLCTARFLDKF